MLKNKKRYRIKEIDEEEQQDLKDEDSNSKNVKSESSNIEEEFVEKQFNNEELEFQLLKMLKQPEIIPKIKEDE